MGISLRSADRKAEGCGGSECGPWIGWRRLAGHDARRLRVDKWEQFFNSYRVWQWFNTDWRDADDKTVKIACQLQEMSRTVVLFPEHRIATDHAQIGYVSGLQPSDLVWYDT